MYAPAPLTNPDGALTTSTKTLTDLNDFITPSQACIKPVEPATVEPGAAAVSYLPMIAYPVALTLVQTEILIDASGSYYEVASSSTQPQKKLEQAQINLNDCLACRFVGYHRVIMPY